jgi:hypothetical protein
LKPAGLAINCFDGEALPSILESTRLYSNADDNRMTSHSTVAAAKALGVSKSTLLRWISEKRVTDVKRDRNGWRVFTGQDLKRINSEIELKTKKS